MAEQGKQQEVKPGIWRVKFVRDGSDPIFDGAMQLNGGALDLTATAAKAAKVRLEESPRGLIVRYMATKNTPEGAKESARCVVVPWARVAHMDMDPEWSAQNRG
jgi:hypothetical protein